MFLAVLSVFPLTCPIEAGTIYVNCLLANYGSGQWSRPMIPATWVAEAGGLGVQGMLDYIVSHNWSGQLSETLT